MNFIFSKKYKIALLALLLINLEACKPKPGEDGSEVSRYGAGKSKPDVGGVNCKVLTAKDGLNVPVHSEPDVATKLANGFGKEKDVMGSMLE